MSRQAVAMILFLAAFAVFGAAARFDKPGLALAALNVAIAGQIVSPRRPPEGYFSNGGGI